MNGMRVSSRTKQAYGLPVAAAAVWQPLLYGACYCAALLLLAAVVFERRDFR